MSNPGRSSVAPSPGRVERTPPSKATHVGFPDGPVRGIEVVAWALAVWMVAFWVTSTVGLGWVPAVALSAVLAGVAARFLRTELAAIRVKPQLGSLTAWAGAVLLVFTPRIDETPRRFGALVLGAIIVGEAMRKLSKRSATDRWDKEPVTSLAVAMVAAIGLGLAAVQTNSWTGFTLAMVALAVASLVLSSPATTGTTHDGHAGRHGHAGRRVLRLAKVTGSTGSTASTELPVYLSGGLLAVWVFLRAQPNPDDIYYLNKAAHYADNPWRFQRRDYLFGLDGLDHLPMADYLSGIEPLAGLASLIPGLDHAESMAYVLAPFAAFLIPFAARYAAAAFGAPRPGLAAVVSAAMIFLHARYAESLLMVDKIPQGKGMAVLVAAPLLAGACINYWEADTITKRRAVTPIAAAICATGLTPSAATVAVGISGAAFVAGAWRYRHLTGLERTRRIGLGVIPLVVGAAIGLYGYYLEHSDPVVADIEPQRRFDEAVQAWVRSTSHATRNTSFPEFELVAILVVTGLVGSLFLFRSRTTRSMFAVITIVLFGVILNPWVFENIVTDRLGLNLLVWRFVWMIPLGVVIASTLMFWIDSRSTLGIALGALAVSSIFWFGTPLRFIDSGPRLDVDPRGLDTARLIIEHTPPGGVFLAPTLPEGATTSMTSEIFPVYGRPLYLRFQQLRGAPDHLLYHNRFGLRRYISDHPQAQGGFGNHLDAVGVDTVCLPEGEFAEPLEAELIARSYTEVAVTNDCRIFVAHRGPEDPAS